MTLGSKGVFLRSASFTGVVPAPAVEVVDTTGAGDAFAAGLATGISEGLDLPDAVRFACRAGALAVTKYGVIPSLPKRGEVDALGVD